MSISGLSNHLCLVVAIIGHLFASTLFRQACAATDSHDFSNSRQFRRNLVVSKYQNNTHWLPNYVWKPPEKFYGPRKRPAWELKKEADSGADEVKRKEYEAWEKKMRDAARREREKWKLPSSDTPTYTTDKTKSKVNLRNDPPNTSFAEHGAKTFFSDATKTPNADDGTSSTPKDTIHPTAFPSGRWGMSMKEAPNEFLQEISSKSTSRGSKDPSMRLDDDIAANQWKNEMNVTTMKSSETKNENPPPVEQSSRPSDPEHQNATPVTFPPGRWGIGVKEPPKDFLKEITRRSQTFEIPDKVWQRKEAKNREFYDAEEARGKPGNNMGRALRKLSMGLSNGRWGMDETSPPGEFLREISRHGHPGITGFYKPGFSHQLVTDTIPINDPRSRELTSSRRLRISNVLFLQPSPGILEIPMFPGFLMNSRILRTSSHPNVPRIRCIICQS